MTADVRMKGFGERIAVDEALALIFERCPVGPAESVPVTAAAGRTLAEALSSPEDLPERDRSAMDGYAARASELPASLPVAAEILAETEPAPLPPGHLARIMTGAPLPVGADCVVRVEDTVTDGDRVRIDERPHPGGHVLRRGEDVRRGQELLAPGRRLRPQDTSLAARLGVLELKVRRRPRVALLPTGSELRPIGVPGSGPVESSSSMLAALVERDGGTPIRLPVVEDDEARLRAAMESVDADLVVLIGGSSVGLKDLGPEVVRRGGRLWFHGVDMKPASPAGAGQLGDRWVLLAPGYPVSSLVAWDVFGRALLAARLGHPYPPSPYPDLAVRLARPHEKPAARRELLRCRFERVADGVIAHPIEGGAALLSTAVRADGYVELPPGVARFEAGDVVTGYRFGDAP